jgi:hypothetical protein
MAVEEVRRELVQLFQRQVETLDSATFLGMTQADRREYDERQTRKPRRPTHVRLLLSLVVLLFPPACD